MLGRAVPSRSALATAKVVGGSGSRGGSRDRRRLESRYAASVACRPEVALNADRFTRRTLPKHSVVLRMGQVVAAYAYRDRRRVREIELGESRDFARSRNEFVWIGFFDPSEAELRVLQAQFDLHDLAVEDALLSHHAPKLEVYGKSLFIVLRTAELADQSVIFGHTYIFLGPDYLITVRRGPSTSYAPVRSRCESDPDLLRLGVDYVLYELVSFVLNHYVTVIAQLQDASDAIDTRIEAEAFERGGIHKLYALRRELVRMRRITGPTDLRNLRQATDGRRARSGSGDQAVLCPSVRTRPYNQRERRRAARGSGFRVRGSSPANSARLGGLSRRFAGWAAILAVPTAIAGIYGMNFAYMPELTWRYGYFVVLGVIALVAGVLFWRFPTFRLAVVAGP